MNWRRVLLGAIVPIVVLGGYAVFSSVAHNPYFPQLTVILERLVGLFAPQILVEHVLPSMTNFVVGYLIAAVSGFLLGVLLGRISLLADLAMPLVTLARSIPPLMLIPPMVLVLGVGDISKIAIIAFGASFPVLVSTIDGLSRTDPLLIDVARSLRLPAWRTLVQVRVISAAPGIFGGLQTALQFALVLMVSSEIIAATRGLGYLTMRAQATFNAPSLWAGLLLLAVIGFAVNAIFAAVRSRALAWHIAQSSTSMAR